jgi:hypothetical protein
MRRFWTLVLVAMSLAAVAAGCGTVYGSDAEPAASDGGVDSQAPFDGGQPSAEAGDAAGTDAATATEGGDASASFPFVDHLVLGLETDAPNGLAPNGSWRDLSKAGHTVAVASGSPLVATTSTGAKAMLFGSSGPYFEVADGPDFQFGTTDDFFIVARATLEEALPLAGAGCPFHYLVSKYSADDATGPHLRYCSQSNGHDLTGALKLAAAEADIAVVPASLSTSYGVVSFGRNQSGTRIETYAAGLAIEVNLPSKVDVSSPGSPFIIGGARLHGTGALFASYLGKINRLYVYHAPGGTFAKADFDAVRAYVQNAMPLP